MARKVDTSAYTDFAAITARLDQIVGEVRKRDLSLEGTLDLFDEAVALGTKAVDFVDTSPVSPVESTAVDEEAHGDGLPEGTPAADA